MKAIILAAGIGNRLGEYADNKPKSLLEFDGKSLLQRHIEILKANNINDIILVVGYQSEIIKQHLSEFSATINFIQNDRFTDGSGISLACALEVLGEEPEFILMDADVLYDQEMINRLVNTDINNCFLLDQDFIPGDEPVKLCVDNNGLLNEFRKQLPDDLQYEIIGESVGFFKFSQTIAKALLERIEDYLAKGENDTPYEEAIRDLLLTDPKLFNYEDVSGVPWIEIDFPEDINRAKNDILPKLSPIKN